MRIRYYGTSASEAWPAMFCECEACKKAVTLGGKNLRTRHQVLIDDSLLIDFPPDTNYHVQQYGLDLKKICSLLVTHSHPDHFYPYDLANRSSQFTNDIPASKMLHIYGNGTVEKKYSEAMKEYQNMDAVIAFHKVAPFDSFLTNDGYLVTACEANHNQFEQSFIYVIRKENQAILFAHDTGVFTEQTWDNLHGIYFDLISLDCTALTRDWRDGHMGIQAVRDTCEALKNRGCIDSHTVIILSHFAHWDGMVHQDVEQMAQKDGYLAAYDTFEYEF